MEAACLPFTPIRPPGNYLKENTEPKDSFSDSVNPMKRSQVPQRPRSSSPNPTSWFHSDREVA